MPNTMAAWCAPALPIRIRVATAFNPQTGLTTFSFCLGSFPKLDKPGAILFVAAATFEVLLALGLHRVLKA